MKVFVLGRSQTLIDTIGKLLMDYEVTGILTAESPEDYQANVDDFRSFSSKHGIPFLKSDRFTEDVLKFIQDSSSDIAISINWPSKISPRVLELFPLGIVNAHGGDLPKYKGNACQAWAIINGEDRVAMTLHQMTEDIDSGPIYKKKYYEIDQNTYIFDIYRWFEDDVPNLFKEVIDGISEGSLTASHQRTDPEFSLRCYPRLPEDGRIDWERSAEDIARLIRASAEPYEGAYAYLEDELVVFWRAHPIRYSFPWCGVPGHISYYSKSERLIHILTGDGLLAATELEKGGHRDYPWGDFFSIRKRFV